MRFLIIRLLRVGLRAAHPCLTLFMLVGLLYPAIALSVTPRVSAESRRITEGNRLRYFWLFLQVLMGGIQGMIKRLATRSSLAHRVCSV